jgi:mRNA interferase MazF
MSPGDVILARLQQSDGRIKNRPALIVTTMPPYDGFLIAAISSQLRQQVAGFDEVITDSDSDSPDSGLKVASLIRIGMVATIPASAVLGELGSISLDRLRRMRENLANHLTAEAGGNEPATGREADS